MKYLLLLVLATHLFSQTIHSSASTYYESKKFTNSKQKNDAVVYGVGVDIHYKESKYKVLYENAHTDTKKPPLKTDLEIEKLFLQYAYELNDKLEIKINYINILDDNIAITDGGQTYALQLSYAFDILKLKVSNFYTDYEDFNVNQTDINLEYKKKFSNVKMKFNIIGKYIAIDDSGIDYKATRNFTKYIDENYLTTGYKFHLHYQGYHFGSAIYLGKRTFAIMNDGFKVQHHAMEFDRTYAVGIGKNISDFVVRLKYVYLRATELPLNNNEKVDVSTTRLIVNYKF